MKKWFAVVLIMCLLIGTLSSCESKNDSSEEIEFIQMEWPTYNNAKQIPIPKSSMAHIENRNDVRFSFYLADTTYEDYADYVAACKEKGFIVDSVEQANRFYAFNNDRYELTVEYHDGDIMYVSVVEERFDVEIKLLHRDKASAKQYDVRIEIDGYWEEDSEKGNEIITFDTYLKEGQHTLSIENDDDSEIYGTIVFTVSEDGEHFEYSIECLSNEIIIEQVSSERIQTTPTEIDSVEESAKESEPAITDSDKNQSNLPDEAESQDIAETEPIVTESIVAQMQSTTEQAYNEACNLTVNDLVKKEDSVGISYSYQGLALLSSDCDWIENPRNTRRTVECGAIYRKIAMVLEGFSIGNNWKGYAEWLIGYIPNSRDDFAPYVENAITFITTSDPLGCMMKKFESLSSVSAFAYDNQVFSFEVRSLKACAKEMQISEKMLGYVFAMLNEYGANTAFNGDSCVFYCKDYRS